MRTVLVADPDRSGRRTLGELCDARGLQLVCCDDGGSALFQAGRIDPNIIVLSAALPVLSAPNVVTAIRRYASTPIALGVGNGEAECAAAGLTAGATVVLSRPYQRRELQPLLRQLAPDGDRAEPDAILTLGALELDGPAYQVRAAGRLMKLPVREFQLLRVLMRHAGCVVSADQLRQSVWGGEPASGNTIAVHVRRLRIRLGGVGDIVNVRGVGYRLAVPAAGAPSGQLQRSPT